MDDGRFIVLCFLESFVEMSTVEVRLFVFFLYKRIAQTVFRRKLMIFLSKFHLLLECYVFELCYSYTN